ncbi:hypothetical protein PFLUV_G00008950 [Xyrichtys novacula]|uniref:Uncharacterized protein n=1 Tax=Xyrichtys novacula TaxID=13765 RepID=A0AAV1ETW7_XYRNO|nr:hypothetical protein PFLUV_G00008950 [Xyrichtys novacula]
MRLLLATAMTLLFLWLHFSAQEPDDIVHENPCKAVSVSETAVSFLLSPLSVYSLLTSTLLRLVLNVPALILTCIYRSLLLLLAGPWCIASVCVSLLLTCLHITLYLLHLALVIGVGAFLILVRHKMSDSDTAKERIPQPKKEKPEGNYTNKTRLGIFGRRVTKQG